MSPFALGHRLPRRLAIPLFGDRERHGPIPDFADPMWHEWEETYLRFYDVNQKQGVGKRVNDAGYRILRTIDLGGRDVIEFGPGDIQHLQHWRGRPNHFTLVDVKEAMLQRSGTRLAAVGVPTTLRVVGRGPMLPFDDASFDVLISFYSFEHLYPLGQYLDEVRRILRPKGQIVGAIPCEGGLAWGLGRWLTTRRWLKRNTGIDPDKIFCWEHPNFADVILHQLDSRFERRLLRLWPLGVPSIDLNLIAAFVYERGIGD